MFLLETMWLSIICAATEAMLMSMEASFAVVSMTADLQLRIRVVKASIPTSSLTPRPEKSNSPRHESIEV